jgi:pimeloyl-ACP methyl ester carboxylesterase
MGAALAGLYATARPERISSLVLIEPPPATIAARTGDPGELLAVQLDYLATPPRQQRFASVEEAARRLRQGFPSLKQELSEAMAARITVPSGDGVEWSWDARLNARAGIGFGSFAGASSADMLASLKKLQAPVALIFGDSSNLVRPEDALALTSSLPSVRKVTLPGGHNLHYDAPDLLAEVIADTVRSANPIFTYSVAMAQDER